MGCYNLKHCVLENKLLTMKGGEFFGTKVKNIFLFGLIHATKLEHEENGEGIRGQLLIISSNPISLDRTSLHQQSNIININRLPLTKAQQTALLKGSICGGGRVSVYVGQFLLGNCVTAGSCGLLNSSSLNILRLLCGNSCAFLVEVDMEKVAPMTDERLNDIITVKMDEAFGQHDDIASETTSSCSSATWSCAGIGMEEISERILPPGKNNGSLVAKLKVGENEIFQFWKIDSRYLLVELIFPEKHCGYQVHVEFLETLVCEPNGEDSFHGPQSTQILACDKVAIKSTMESVLTRKSREDYGAQGKGEMPKLVSEALMLFAIPDYNNERDQTMLNILKVRDILHFCKIQLVKSTKSNKIGSKISETVNIGHKKVLRRNSTFPPAASIPKTHIAPNAAPSTSSSHNVINEQAIATAAAVDSTAHSYVHCCFPVKLILVKAAFPNECKHMNGESCDVEYDC